MGSSVARSTSMGKPGPLSGGTSDKHGSHAFFVCQRQPTSVPPAATREPAATKRHQTIMGLFGFGSSNDCRFKDQCPIAGVDGTCSHCHDSSYTDCDLYQEWSGASRTASCPLKSRCPDFPHDCLWGDHPEDCFRYQMST